MRGKAISYNYDFLRCGITPAHAGKSSVHQTKNLKIQDHPRTCGEKIYIILVALYTLGSPPHMRGKGISIATKSKSFRITPAHAGKRDPNTFREYGMQDHPRTCGEKLRYMASISQEIGSPPHMRGKAPLLPVTYSPVRITPAHAGKRST